MIDLPIVERESVPFNQLNYINRDDSSSYWSLKEEYLMKKIRIGSGAGYAGDRIEPAMELIQKEIWIT